MKSALLALFVIGIAQASNADIQCADAQHHLILRMSDNAKTCSFDLTGPDINLGYLGRRTPTENGFVCDAIAFTTGEERSASLEVRDATGILTIGNSYAFVLDCQ